MEGLGVEEQFSEELSEEIENVDKNDDSFFYDKEKESRRDSGAIRPSSNGFDAISSGEDVIEGETKAYFIDKNGSRRPSNIVMHKGGIPHPSLHKS